MDNAVTEISVQGLALAFVPAVIVIFILHRWSAGAPTALYATARMLAQLLLIGYLLVYLFALDQPAPILAVLVFMLTVASWIAVRPVRGRQPRAFVKALAAISLGGLPVLALVVGLVLDTQPWFSPRHLVPLGGMIFAGAMNAVSIAAERLQSETERGVDYADARREALQAALIPVINSLFAVGLVSLPGMMTGQILSGVSPLVAAQYQIVVMTMLFGAAGIAASFYLRLAMPPNRGETTGAGRGSSQESASQGSE